MRRNTIRSFVFLSLGVLLSGCSEYRTVAKSPEQSWQEARRAAAVAAVANAPVDQAVHRVRRGDNLARLAKLYGTSSRALITSNSLKPPFSLREGQMLKVPPRPEPVIAARMPAAESPVTVVAALPTSTITAVALPAPETSAAKPEPALEADPEITRQAQQAKPPALSGEGFLWPLQGATLSGFGDKPNGQRNEGINLAAVKGQPIRAAENGIVVHASDSIPGFGRMLLIRHADSFTTLYAHTSAIGVRVGDKVSRGQIVAYAGDSGDVKVPQVHFELRMGTKAIDPTEHMVPAKTQVASR